MTKRTMHTLGLILLAMPLVAVGCGGSDDNNGGTGGAGGIGGGLKYDSGTGTGGVIGVDAANTPDLPVAIDTLAPAIDTKLSIDLIIADAPLAPDAAVVLDVAPALDVNVVADVPRILDVQASEAQPVDTTPAIDSTPVVAVCKESTKFSGGAVNINRTLTKACSPYTIKTDIDVYSNSTLTIEAGVTLNFETDTNLAVAYSSAGKLSAVGTATDPIVFTSANATPGAGDWAGIQLWGNTMNGTTLAYVTLDYCGSAGDACIVSSSGVKPNRVTLDHVTFSHVGSGSNAIWQKDKDSNFLISNCTFNDIPKTPTQQYAISVAGQSFAGIDANNTFNGGAMVELMADTITTDTTWKNIGTVVAVTGELSVGGASNPTLTIAAGSILKFAINTGFTIGYSNPGSLVLAGTATKKITLTSLAVTPAPADWDGITIWGKSTVTIAYSTISYAGSDTSSAKGAVSVVSDAATLDIQDSTVSFSGTYGLGVPCNSTANLTNNNNTFTSNGSGDVGPGPTGVDCS